MVIMAGKTLQPISEITQYEQDAHRFDTLSYKELEEMRQNAEQQIGSMDKIEQVSAALQQSISARLLNQNYGMNYHVADFDKDGNVYMTSMESEPVARNQREIPELPYEEPEPSFDDEFSL